MLSELSEPWLAGALSVCVCCCVLRGVLEPVRLGPRIGRSRVALDEQHRAQ